MKKKIVIIGAGPGGYSAALHASRLGAEATLVEQEKTGGVCLNWGCIPSKIFKNTADILEQIKKAELYGIRGVHDPGVDMLQLLQRQENVIATLAKGIDAQLQRAHVARKAGVAKVCGPGRLTVVSADGTKSTLDWDKLILAAGSRPLELANMPFDGKRVLSSSDLLQLSAIPESLVIVGGGVIGCEFAYILNAYGCKVTIVEALDRLLPLPSIDLECSKVLARQMKKKGIQIRLNSVVAFITRTDGLVEVAVHGAGASPSKTDGVGIITAEKVAVCVGRQSVAGDLGLDNIDLPLDPKGWVTVDEHLQTQHPDVYAIGDILGPSKPMLAHAASKEAVVAVENCLGGSTEMVYDFVPSVVFSDPEIGCVGLSEQGAIAAGIDVASCSVLFRTCGKAHAIGEIDGSVKIIAKRKTGELVGIHIVGPHASDLLGEAVVLVRNGMTLDELADTIHAHPTLAEPFMEAAQELKRSQDL